MRLTEDQCAFDEPERIQKQRRENKKENQHEPHKRFHGILITKKTKQDMWKMQVR
jgi:hypothetical protein